MVPTDVLTRTTEPPDAVVRYGDHAEAVIDLFLPPREMNRPLGPSPLVVFIHGGFWRVAYDRTHTRPLATALAREGFVVATPEYRRVGGRGGLAGGWPATFEDVSDAVGSLPRLLDELGIGVTRTTVMGHSAGGHLALWLANEPNPIDRVVGLAPVGDLRAAAAASTGGDAVPDLLGGSPEEVPEVYDAADPATRLATRPDCELVLVHGTDDDAVPVANSRGLHESFPALIGMHELAGVDHYALIDPLSAAWPVVLSAATAEATDLG